MHKLNSGATLMALAFCIFLFTLVASEKKTENSFRVSQENMVKMTG